MALVDFKLVLIAVLMAALMLVWRSSEDLAAPSSFTTDAAHAQHWSPISLRAVAQTAVDSLLNTNTSSLTSAAASTLESLLRSVGADDATTIVEASSNSSSNSNDDEEAASPASPAAAAGGGKTVHKLCVMSRIHNQPRSLAEWLEYHAALGVTRFFLVDDCSADGGRTRTVMDVYQQEGLVKYFTSEDVTRSQCAHVVQGHEAEMERAQEHRRKQLCRVSTTNTTASEEDTALGEAAAAFEQLMAGCAYTCGEHHRPNEMLLFDFMFRQATTSPDETCEWLMVFDTDEYMTFQTDLFPTPDVPAYIADWEERTNGFPVLRFLWVMVGSDGHEERPPGLVVDNFHNANYPKWMLKTAAKTEFLNTWKFSHWPSVKDVSNETSVQEYGFEIPPPYKTLQEFTERNWQTEQPIKGTELRYRNWTRPESNETIQCLYPSYGVFLKHYSWRSFEEFKAHRSQSRVKSDGQGNSPAVDDPHGTWQGGANPGMYGHACSEAYFNDFTALMANKTRENLAAREARWNEAHTGQAAAGPDDDYEAWMKKRECGTGPEGYSGAFPPVEDWVIR